MSTRPQWTAANRAAFIASLAECGEVRAALATVGLSPKSAYRLRATDPDFARAWDTALLHSRQAIVGELTSRALHGWQEEVWFRGELVGTRTRHDSRLLLALLARLDKAAGSVDQPERTRRAATHFGDVLAALRHDVSLEPWFEPNLAERQKTAIDAACRRNDFWKYAALMDDATIDWVIGAPPAQGDDEEEDDYDDEETDDDPDEALDTADNGPNHPAPLGPPVLTADAYLKMARPPEPAPSPSATDGLEAPDDTVATESPDETDPSEAANTGEAGARNEPDQPLTPASTPGEPLPERGCYPVLPSDHNMAENQDTGIMTPHDDQSNPWPAPPPLEPPPPPGPPTADERDAFEGELAQLNHARFPAPP